MRNTPSRSRFASAIEGEKRQITRLQRLITNYEDEERRYKALMATFPVDRCQALSLRIAKYKSLSKYDKCIDMSLVEQTSGLFAAEQAKLDHLAEEIADHERRIAGLKSHTDKIRQIMRTLRLPSFADDLLKFNFNECLLLDASVIDYVKNIRFHEGEIAAVEQERARLTAYLESIKPVYSTLAVVVDAPSLEANRVTVLSSAEMVGAKSYETGKMERAVSACGLLARDRGRLLEVNGRLNESIGLAGKTLDGVAEKVGKAIRARNHGRDRMDDDRALKAWQTAFVESERRVCEKDDELEDLVTDLPDMSEKSHDGLIKWRNALLARLEVVRSEYPEKVAKARESLQDAKVLYQRRLKTLREAAV